MPAMRMMPSMLMSHILNLKGARPPLCFDPGHLGQVWEWDLERWREQMTLR